MSAHKTPINALKGVLTQLDPIPVAVEVDTV